MELIFRMVILAVAPVVAIAVALVWSATGSRLRRLWLTASVLIVVATAAFGIWQASHDNPEAPFVAVAMLAIVPIGAMAAMVHFGSYKKWHRLATGCLAVVVGAASATGIALWIYTIV